ncbi:MAG: bifunctional adenosylcobinamide kinase/adenosylcobinamide-phosphate guanylyltransferase [Oscillospiraceae bacterium]|nr:bifunctional adenosylcobinamide kinase/adenosylcobinamide-phosphate guanylyltransferase [Oscillospiraceae bacterium]
MMILLTGGSACGKSSYAEDICLQGPAPRFYLAAMQPYGEDGQRKVQRHRALRAGKGFETIERYTDYASLKLPARGTALLECICNLTANEMFDENGNQSDPCERVLSGVENLAQQCDLLIVITNDVGSGGDIYEDGTNDYIRAVGAINSVLASRADTVIEMVAGIPILVKGELPLCN